MLVMKFGGTSVGSGERIAGVAELVATRLAEEPLVVVSAMGGVTDALLDLSRAAREGDRAAAAAALATLGERHLAALDGLGLEPVAAAALREEIGAERARLEGLATGVALLGELSARTSDAILAAGELLSAALLSAALAKRGVAVARVDPREWMATDASHGAAAPDEAAIAANVARRLLPERAAGRVVVTGGFVGAAPGGSTTTLGRGGSDYSAALLGAALLDSGAPVSAIEIWTDVDGILTADPRVVPAARIVPEVGYAEAAELAFFGAKVLHPATIRPAIARGLPVRVRNTFQPAAPGTTVRSEAPGTGVRALAMRPGVAALFVGSPRMLLAHGYAARVFSVFEKHAVPVDVIATSEVSISITVDAKAPLAELVRDLSAFAEVSVLTGLAVVSVVGRKLRSTPRVAASVFAALGEINVVLISQGASETNLTFVVEAKDAPEALRRLHRELFEMEAA
ncbi:MAG: aspartate kinase [Thermoanaerobaculia bacterium]|nr:aspartate kinase [Thermoanaerobaculia bacterium]